MLQGGTWSRGGAWSRGQSAPGGAWSRGAAPGGGMPDSGGAWFGGVCSRGGVSQHALKQIPLCTEFLTHVTENITLPQISFAGGNK